jgi:asparagine synthase (glutamine-hydrolysing)
VREYCDPWRRAVSAPKPTWAEDGGRLLELLRAATRARMVSEVPLGVMLSGGIDSSLIATLMAEASPRPIKTFSVGFVEDGEANELAAARRVADRLGSEHHELTTSALEQADLLDEALWHMEEPVADLSHLGFLALSRLARRSVTVALSGQGADELLGGYRKHQIAAGAAALARVRGLRGLLDLASDRLAPESSLARGLTALTTRDPAERLLAMSRVVSAEQRLEMLEPDFLETAAEEQIAEVVSAHLPPRRASPLDQTLHADARMALVDNMFLYFDKMSMAASLEVRVPFMDVDVVEFCRGLPDSRKVWLTRRKELLRRASRGILPDEVIDQKKRGFFHSALGTWLRLHRDTLIRDTLLDPRALARGQFRPEVVRALVDSAGRDGKKSDQRLFCMFLLERWQCLFVDGQGMRPTHPQADQRPLVLAS